MSELTDLNATGNGLSAVSGGLQGLLEAYKMKMAQNVEQQKLAQQGLDAGANARAMGAYRMAALNEKTDYDNWKMDHADSFAAAGTPILLPDPNNPGQKITVLTDGKGGIKNVTRTVPTAPGAAKAKSDTALEMLDSLSQKWDGLGTGDSTMSATLKGSSLKAQSLAPSTAAGQYDAAAQAFAGKLDHDLLGRVNDLTIANAKKAIPGFFDTPESKKNKMDYIRGIYAGAPAAAAPAPVVPGAAPAPAATVGSLPAVSGAPNYSDPQKAAQIAAQYKAGPQTAQAYAATKAQLDALTVGQ